VVAPYADQFPEATFYPGKKPWEQKVDLALPCATQNELHEADAKNLIDNGVTAVVEGANMPSTPDAIKLFKQAKILYSPGKASNAGGVAVSGLEMSQNSLRVNWTAEEVDAQLKIIMKDIHATAVKYGKTADGWVDYEKGANIAGFVKVADAMLAQGVV
jgi:glutamate dehydrogenase (NADP+)